MLIRFRIGNLTTTLSSFQAIQEWLIEKDKKSEELTEEERKDIYGKINEIEDSCRLFNLNIDKCVIRLKNKVKDPEKYKIPLWSFWRDLRHRISDELERHLFMYVPETHADYYEHLELFGREVSESFPSARNEIREAGNCYAVGLNTACVFHLMRAVEVALKQMVVVMKAKKHLTKPDKSSPTGKKQIPPELCDWDTLIKGLRAALREMEAGKKTNAKVKATHAFYSEAINTFSEFKDAWRNTISHGHDVASGRRKLYKDGETADIMKSTRHFLAILAKRIKE